MSAPVHDLALLVPDWPVPAQVRAVVTERTGGVSVGPYSSLNLAMHVGDDPAAVTVNRARLRAGLALSVEPCWLEQVHGVEVVDAAECTGNTPPRADAAVAFSPGAICVVMTADCLPVLLCDRAGTRVAAAHAGWRGLADGVLAATVARLACPPGELLAWLGPAIGPGAFEVGPEVRDIFLHRHATATDCFRAASGDRWLADIYQLARIELDAMGVKTLYGGGRCTVRESERFFSYRRDRQCGRMASLIWLQS